DPRVSTAAQLLWRRPHAEVAEVADAVGWSTRQLRRALPAEVGLGPKTLQRVGRLQRFLALVRTGRYPGLAELAFAAGDADQPHLSREARALSGLTPAHLVTHQTAPPPADRH